MVTDTPIEVWDAVAGHLERFASAWATGLPPDPARFAPEGPPGVRRMSLIELVKLDIELRLPRGQARPLEEYIRDFPELAVGGPPCDLLYEDYHLRRQAGESVDSEEYYRRFPSAADGLAQLLGEGAVRSTSVAAAAALHGVEPGERLDDFDLLALLGEGQFARVFLARQRGMQRLVALKVSAARGAEAQTLAQLDHPHIVRVYDQRVLTDPPFLLVYMTYVPGGTLLNLLDHARPIPLAARSGRTLVAAVDVALDARGEVRPSASPVRTEWSARSWPGTVCSLGAKLAAALDYAHRQGVLHRDIKPANILLTADGEPLLADFNLGSCSKLDGAGPASLFGGSLPYMAPEHLEAFNPDHPRPAESLDGRADLYGLAVTLWELWTGGRPFGAEPMAETWPATLDALTARRRTGPPIPPNGSDGDAVGLGEVLRRCLDPDPDRRPATAGEMVRELELCLRPATRALVRPAPGGWREVVKRHPFLAMVPCGLLPNVLMSFFNIDYNRKEIIEHWPEADAVFQPVILAVNGVFFPVGILLFFLAAHRVAWRPGRAETAEDRARKRGWSLALGRIAAGVCAGCWLVAGVVWPAVLRIVAGPPPQGPEAYLHFVASLALCGLVAAAYPYFLVTFLAVRVLYPTHLGPDGATAADATALRQVGRELGLYRALATAVPLVALALLIALMGEASTFALKALIAAGLAGTAVAFLLEGRIRADLAALEEVGGSDPGEVPNPTHP